jgi:cell division protein FtsL
LIDYKVGNPLKPSAEARAAQDAQREEFEAELKRRIATRDKIDDISLYLIAVVLITAVLMFAGSFLYKRWSSQQVQSILVDFCCHFNVHVNFDFIAA